MRTTDAIVIGAGQAGLAMSHCLAARGIDHLVLERGRVAERWRSERWDSLRLLTPNWMTRLPGRSYRGADPDGFMTMPEVVGFLDGYAAGAPVESGVAVRALHPALFGYRLETSAGTFAARAVVVATGQCDLPHIPAMAAALPKAIRQVTPSSYRNPAALPPGGVLVVGASASGVQIAEEIHRSGRPVTLAVGRHTRLPRRWRGRDILDWMDRAGVLDERADEVRDLAAARAQPSLQLVGRPDHASIDLGTLRAIGVRVTGRVVAVDGPRILQRDDLNETTAAAQRTLDRLLARLGAVADREGAPREAHPAPLRPFARSPRRIDLAADGIRTIVWATGFRRGYAWLRLPVLDAAGEIRHRGGVTPAPGLFVLGLRFLRRRNSNFLDGVGADAEHLAGEVLAHLATSGRLAA
ncbi:NAD(P)-binding domain-containing protein [Neoroseomonas oryzicola]|uniref:NAD(P)-binding domain-containing protein n=1 Tax=Neoroseomonas oryzicola TaxID=535904 RepID=A0A9X9WIE8_9PROT|nr:NAD(P)-binding domain-containing protein [Neoroseomonas oryzicola]MBR0660108.1 NAD(P)-binding domain-containing protein [Neoroseomonas oryzicola]NKE18171.1 NAD(P)-binding domain-containing protein [Neoroseomonas oryzicola]